MSTRPSWRLRKHVEIRGTCERGARAGGAEPPRGNGTALAEVLREHPPAPDDLSRARMEQRVLAAATSGRSARRPWLVLASAGIGLAAAAAAIALFVPRDSEAPIARFERREASASIERGTLDEGSTIRTAAHDVADVRVVDSRVRIEGASRVRIAALTRDRLALELDEGAVRVAFHPRERGRERMMVETPSARVEVVGTVFRVEVRGGETRVSVSEGTVRVVPLEGGAPRLVHAGEHTRVGAGAAREEARNEAEPPVVERAPARAVREPSDEDADREPGAADDEASEAQADESPSAEEDRLRDDPRAVLDEAGRLIEAGRTARAMAMLRELARASAPAPIRTEAWLRIGDVSESTGQMPQAARAYREAERAGHGTSQGHNATFALARLQDRRLHDADAARASYERYLSDAPEGALASQARAALCRLGVTERCGGTP